MFSEKILEIFKNPTNVGITQGASAVGQYINPETADNYKLYVKVEDGKIVESSFKAFTGVVGIALMTTLTEMVKGLTIDELTKIEPKSIVERIGAIDADYMYLLNDCVLTLNATYDDYQKRLEKLLKAKK